MPLPAPNSIKHPKTLNKDFVEEYIAQSSSTLHFDGVFEDVEIDTLSDRPLVCHDSLLPRELSSKLKGTSCP